MIFNNHSNLEGQHAFLGASKYHWINYDETKVAESYSKFLATQRGTVLHDFACQCIRLGQKLPKSQKTLNMYVNDAISFRMVPEQILFYSENCFGTADTIVFRNNTLRIHDLKTGVVPAHMEQLEIYAALFCLEYKVKPANIDIELRLYQNNEILYHTPTVEDIAPIMDKIITFDMGGTSADISLIENYTPQVSNERYVEGYPARIPMINIITIGAGGGSIAKIDEGGALKVGPKSAGATPGPACYMRGGENPCVTDANIVLGKLNQKKILGGRMDVDIELAKNAVKTKICDKSNLDMKRAANGIITVVNSNMVRAIRSVSVEKGYDVREFSLMAFGGAGPLHACEVAKELGMKEVLIPPHPGTLCSLGLLLADTKFDLSRTKIMNGEAGNLDDINEQFDNMVEQGTGLLDKEGVPADRRYFEFAVDMRYQRQNFEISIPVPAGKMTEETLKKALADFHAEHKRSYGYCKEDAIVQFVSYRVSAIGVIDKPDLKAAELHPEAPIPEPIEVRQVLFQNSDEYVETPVYLRDKFVPGQSIPGPCICEQMDTTLVVPKGWVIHVDGYHNLKIHDEEAK